MTVAQRGGDGQVAASHLSIHADPLHRLSALLRCKAEISQVQSLPRHHRDGVGADHPTCQETGAGGAEPAVSIEDQDRQAGVRAHLITVTRSLTRAATRR